jgi:hypothetical protein
MTLPTLSQMYRYSVGSRYGPNFAYYGKTDHQWMLKNSMLEELWQYGNIGST